MLDELAALLDHNFKNMAVLSEAVTHGSIGAKKPNYERLEFLGDACCRLLSLICC